MASLVRRAGAGLATAVAIVAVVGACNASTPTAKLPADRNAGTAPSPAIAHVGTAGFVGTDADNVAVAVTLTQVIDPVAPAGGQQAAPGKQDVATIFKVSDVGIAPATEAGTDVTLLGSDGRTYQPVGDSVTGCANFGSHPFTVQAGQALVGCAVFQLPSGVQPARATFTPSDGGATGVWQIP